MPAPETILRPYLERLREDLDPATELFDAHTHIGVNDPDGFKQTPEALMEALRTTGARALVFPSMEPSGYGAANDAVLEAAAASDGRLECLCRVDPNEPDAVREAIRCLDAGARGIKLHPRAELFTLSHPTVRELVALAHERRAPVLIHAGRGIPALGQDTVRLSGEFTGARMILAHAAISDLAWLWKVMPEHPNLFIDTSWWSPTDLVALFRTVAPGQILWASDAPYGHPMGGAVHTGRTALQAGVAPDALRAVFGAQLQRVLDGDEPLDLGPPPSAPLTALDPLLERVNIHLTATLSRLFVRAEHAESLGLARLACAVGDDGPHADVHAAVLELLDLFEEHLPASEGQGPPPAVRFLIAALWIARTPDVPLPARPEAPAPTRDEAE